jgi:3'(2'), 5'-bisphosphate nucleotidase
MEFNLTEKDIIDLGALTQDAAQAILKVKSTAFNVDTKHDDSPVTLADHASNEVLLKGLPGILDIPIVSEEQNTTTTSDCFWLIDPLDGTESFIKGGQEYCICVALIKDKTPLLGHIFDVETHTSYSAIRGQGLYKNGNRFNQAHEAKNTTSVLTSSREKYDLGKIKQTIPHTEELTPMSSALKFSQIGFGTYSHYFRSQPCYGWDIAAGQVIVEEAGYKMKHLDGAEIVYDFTLLEKVKPFYVTTKRNP